jgi:tyrosine-protein phosphatase SIW14
MIERVPGTSDAVSPRRSRRRWLTWAVVAALVTLGVAAVTEIRATLAFRDEKRSLEGVSNFGQVAPRLYRGAQPSDAGFVALRALGVDTVVSFTLGAESIADEARRVRAIGMDHISIPWSASHEPSPDAVNAFLAIFREHPDRTVFVHCWQGVDRTGVMVALYRIAHDGWTVPRALDEMRAFHYRFIFQPHLQHFVEAYGPTLARPLAATVSRAGA